MKKSLILTSLLVGSCLLSIGVTNMKHNETPLKAENVIEPYKLLDLTSTNHFKSNGKVSSTYGDEIFFEPSNKGNSISGMYKFGLNNQNNAYKVPEETMPSHFVKFGSLPKGSEAGVIPAPAEVATTVTIDKKIDKIGLNAFNFDGIDNSHLNQIDLYVKTSADAAWSTNAVVSLKNVDTSKATEYILTLPEDQIKVNLMYKLKLSFSANTKNLSKNTKYNGLVWADAVNFYAKAETTAPTPEDEVNAFAKKIIELTAADCVAKDIKVETWTTVKTAWAALSTDAQKLFKEATANEAGTDLEKGAARYDACLAGHSNLTDFAGRANTTTGSNAMSFNNDSTIIIVSVSVLTVALLGAAVLLMKRRKVNE